LVQEVDCIVVGAGVVGIAVARQLALAKREVVVLEAADTVGSATSARSSEVIHAGIYYPKNSLKAALCVRGRRLLYQYCAEKKIPHREVGKLIVATEDAEMAILHDLHARAVANAAGKVEFLTAAEAQKLEPALRCVGALHVHSTGIVDSRALMLAMQSDAEAAGATFVLRTPFRSARAMGAHFEVTALQRAGERGGAERAVSRRPHPADAEESDPAALPQQGAVLLAGGRGALPASGISDAAQRRSRHPLHARHGMQSALRA